MQSLPTSLANLTPTEVKPASGGGSNSGQPPVETGGDAPQFARMMGNLLGDENATMEHSGSEQGAQTPSDQDSEQAAVSGLTLSELAAQAETGKEDSTGLNLASTGQATRFTDTDPAISATQQAQRATAAAQQAAVAAASGGKDLPPSGHALPLQADLETTQFAAQLTPASDSAKSALPPGRTELDLDSQLRIRNRHDRFSELKIEGESLREPGEFISRRSEFPSPERTSAALQFLQSVGPQGRTEADSAAYLSHLNQAGQATQQTSATIPKLDSASEMQLTLDNARSAAGKPEPVLRDQLTTPFGNARWHADFAGKLRVLSQGNVSTVELNLNPAELGAIDIRIKSLDDGTVINFFTANANTREVIDASLPRLRELLADSGIQLQHGDVSERNSDSQRSESHSYRELAIELPDEMTDLQPVFRSRQESRSMVDHYV